MTNQLTPQQTFEETIKDRLRDDIGRLLPDEVLTAMINRSIEEMFFKKEVKPDRSLYARPEFMPSWFIRSVEGEIKTRSEEVIRKYFNENAESISKQVADSLAEQGPKLLATFLVNIVRGTALTHEFQVANCIRELLGKH